MSLLSRNIKPFRNEIWGIIVTVLLFSMVMYGCKTTKSVRIEYRDSLVYRNSIDSVLVYNTDSVIVKEKGDTVFIEKWKTRYIDKTKIRTDTIYKDIVNTEKEVVKEKYIPSFYKWCTGIAIVLFLGVLIYAVIKIKNRIGI